MFALDSAVVEIQEKLKASPQDTTNMFFSYLLFLVNARNKSEKDYGIVEASLIQKALFSSPSTTRIARKQLVLRTVHGPPLLKVLSMQV